VYDTPYGVYISSRALRAYSIGQASIACTSLLEQGLIPFLMGMPGCGKTQLVRQKAREMQLYLIEIMGSKLPEDHAHGIPVILTDENGNKTFSPAALKKFADPIRELQKTGRINKNGKTYKGVLLFVDELNRSSTETLKILFDTFSTHNLPGLNWEQQHAEGTVRCIAAGNPPIGAMNVKKIHLDDAWDRRIVEICLDYTQLVDWLPWARENNIKKEVIRFLKNNRGLLHVPRVGDQKSPTPATWEMVSNILYHDNFNIETANWSTLGIRMTGMLGVSVADGFIQSLREGESYLTATEVITESWKSVNTAIKEALAEGRLASLSSLAEDYAALLCNPDVLDLVSEKAEAKALQFICDRSILMLEKLPRDTQGLFFMAYEAVPKSMSPEKAAVAKGLQAKMNRGFGLSQYSEKFQDLVNNMSDLTDGG